MRVSFSSAASLTLQVWQVGCPQRCARKGGFGAFLMDKPELLRRCVEAMSTAIRRANPLCACCVKIRCFDDTDATIALARVLQAAGCQCLTVHGRTRGGGGGKRTGKWLANWDWIRSVKRAVSIPVVSNGNIRVHHDIEACLAYTGADCVMSGCGALKRPFIFSSSSLPTQKLVWESIASDDGLHPGADTSTATKPAGNQWERRLQCALLYLGAAAKFDAHPRQIAKHLQEMVPKAVLRRPAARTLGQRMALLAAGTCNHAAVADLRDLSADLAAVLQDLSEDGYGLPAAACQEVSDSEEEGAAGGGGEGAGRS